MPFSTPFSPLTSLRLHQLACFGMPCGVSKSSDARRRSAPRLHRRHVHRRHQNVHHRRWSDRRRSAHVRHRRSSGHARRRNSERNATHRSWAIRDIHRNCRANIHHTGYARSAAAYPTADAKKKIHVPGHSSNRHNRYSRAAQRNPVPHRHNHAASRNSVPYGSSSSRCRRAPRRNWIRHARPGCLRAA